MIPGALIILQARLASRRCPGKALAMIGGRPILARCLDRLRDACAAPVVLATTTNPEDDALAALAQRADVPVVRGPEHDVLRRFVLAAARFNATFVVRATADNPAVDIDAPRRVLETLVTSGADYVAEYGLPYGACVEGVVVDALEKADAVATAADDREHVTPLIRRGRPFHALQVPAPLALQRPDLRLTVDSPEDLEFMRRIMSSLGNPAAEPSLAAIIAVASSLSPFSEAAAS
jgi:spore coat polysaccharide biosynthesis protein SpsF (cytidylyltransferase family)